MKSSAQRGIVSHSFEYQNNKLFSLCDAFDLTKGTFLLFVASICVWLYAEAAEAQQKPDLTIPVTIWQDKSAIVYQASKFSVARNSNPTQPPAALKVTSTAKTYKPLKRIKPSKVNHKQVRTLPLEFVEVEIVLSDQFSIEYISPLLRAPGSDLEALDGSKKCVRVQLPASRIEALVDDGAEITVLRKFMLVEGSTDKARTPDRDMTTLRRSLDSYCYGSNSDNKDIPDDGLYGGWAYSDIPISCAPGGAIVSSIDVHYEIIHTYVGDLYVDLTDYDQTDTYVLWLYEGGSADNINETETGITTFNGKIVNQTWLLWATDDYLGDSGYIDYWWIKVYYEDKPDLVVERLYVSPSSSTSGKEVEVTVKVTNCGTVAAGAFEVDFYKDRVSAPGSGDDGDHTWNVSSLAAGASTTLTWQFTPPGNGSYNAWAQVDRTNAVIESDDTNNKKGPFLYKVEEPGDVTYYAVICGIAEYPEPISDLVWTDDDANDINDTLVQYPEWSSGNIQLLIDSQATKSGIKAAVDTMRQQADANDICLFFMAGHGTTGQDKCPFDESDDVDEYLVSCDAGGLSDWISDDEFGEWFEAFPAPVTVLLDTCFSGGQIRELADANLAVRSFSVGYPSPAKGDGFATDIALALGLEKFGKRDLDDTLTAGGVVVTAADDDEPSWESNALENGVFTEYVLEALDGERETADTNDDGDVSAEEVYDYAAPRATQYCIDHGMEPPQHAQLYDNYPPDSPSLDDLTVVAPIPGDFEPDGDVDMDDLAVLCDQWLLKKLSADVAPIEGGSFVDFLDWAVFANAWQSTPSSPNWNPKCDIAPEEGDDIVNLNDLAVFVDQWLQFGAYCADIAPAPDGDGVVNLLDFAVFAENWLEGTNP